MSNWNNPETAKQYIQVISDKEQNAKNKFYREFYHDPFFLTLLPKELEIHNLIELGAGNLYFSKPIFDVLKPISYYAVDFYDILSRSVLHNQHGSETAFLPYRIATLAEQLPFTDNYFDFLVSSMLLHWVEKKEMLFEEAKRILKNDATLVFSLAHPDTYRSGKFILHADGQYHHVKAVNTDEKRIQEVEMSGSVGPVYYYGYPVSDYTSLLDELGFKDIEIFAPTTSAEQIEKCGYLKKYQNSPSYLFIRAKNVK